MILAAGFGTRLRPLTRERPKPLLHVAGRPLIEHLLCYLASQGVAEVVINLHHLGDQVQKLVGDGAGFALRVRYSWEREVLDSGGGIKHAEPLLGGEPFLVINGDTLLDLDLADLFAKHRARAALATLVVREDPDAARYGLLELDDADRIRRFLGRPPSPPCPLRPFMFAGVHLLDPRIFTFMPPDRPFSITRDTYPELVAAGEAVFGYPFRGRWLTIDTPSSLAKADAELRRYPLRFSRRAASK